MKLANTLSIYQPTSKLAYFCWWKLANTFEAYDIDKFAPLISFAGMRTRSRSHLSSRFGHPYQAINLFYVWMFKLFLVETPLDVPLFNMTCYSSSDDGILVFGGETVNNTNPIQSATSVRFWSAKFNSWTVNDSRYNLVCTASRLTKMFFK